MNNDYFNYKKCIDDLTSVLSIAYFYKFSTKAVEKRITESKYFSLFNSSFLNSKSYIDTEELLSEIFPDVEINNIDIYYDELEWVSTMYLYLINKTNYNFETIFIYIGIEDAMKMFKLYHELDLNDSYNRFIELKNNSSIIAIKMKVLKLTNRDVAKTAALSLSMIDSLRNRRRDIKKLDAYHAVKLAKALNIDIETLLNN